jgi:hypothetical protein
MPKKVSPQTKLQDAEEAILLEMLADFFIDKYLADRQKARHGQDKPSNQLSN